MMGGTSAGRVCARVGVAGAALIGLLVASGWAPALASKPSRGGGGTPTPVGNDISYPQCGTAFPRSAAFGIVGLNDGLANSLNPCFGPSSSASTYSQTELYWAEAKTLGGTTQPKASLYVNTGDPGDTYNGRAIADWPTSSSSADPYGSCTTTSVVLQGVSSTVGENTTACAWQYGDNRATQDAAWLTAAANAIDAQAPPVAVPNGSGSYPWWLDVETANSWQPGASGQAMNVADLQGMVAGLQAAGATVIGAYSTSSMWTTITGGTSTSSSGSIFGLPDWIPGATGLTGAKTNCRLAGFTGGPVRITQYTSTIDNDVACP